MKAYETVRRMIVVATLAMALVPPMLACSGGAATDAETPTTPEPDKANPANKLVGVWRMIPEETELRRLKVIDAAISGKAQKKEKLGKLTAEEEKLFKEWEKKEGPALKEMKAQLRFARGCQFTFTDTEVTVAFDEEKYGPVAYTVVSATDVNTTIRFDPGLGNGTETHSIDWTSATKGVDHIKGADGQEFPPINIAKR